MITLTIIIPLYNEERRVGRFISAIRIYHPPAGVRIDRVIFVSDGSTDNTLHAMSQTIIPYPTTILSYKENKGRGYALRTALEAATGDYALWMDVDLSTPLAQLARFAPLMKRNIPVIIASRVKKGARVSRQQPWYRTMMGNGFRKLSRFVLGIPVEDFNCGFKAFSREVYTTIFPLSKINGWGNDSETLFLSQKCGYPIAEVPTRWRHDPDSKVRIAHDLVVSFSELLAIRGYDMLGMYDNQTRVVAALDYT